MRGTQRKANGKIAAGFMAAFIALVVYAGEASARPDGSYGFDCSTCHSGRPDQTPPGANQTPTLNAPGDKTANIGETLRINLSATDDALDTVSFSFTSSPTATGMTLTPGTTPGTATFTQHNA